MRMIYLWYLYVDDIFMWLIYSWDSYVVDLWNTYVMKLIDTSFKVQASPNLLKTPTHSTRCISFFISLYTSIMIIYNSSLFPIVPWTLRSPPRDLPELKLTIRWMVSYIATASEGTSKGFIFKLAPTLAFLQNFPLLQNLQFFCKFQSGKDSMHIWGVAKINSDATLTTWLFEEIMLLKRLMIVNTKNQWPKLKENKIVWIRFVNLTLKFKKTHKAFSIRNHRKTISSFYIFLTCICSTSSQWNNNGKYNSDAKIYG